MDINDMTLNDIELRLIILDKEVRNATDIGIIEKATEDRENLLSRKKEIEDYNERKETARNITNNNGCYKVIDKRLDIGGNSMQTEIRNEQQDLEVRAFQKYILGHQMEETEKRALAISGAAAVLPTQIMANLITSEKYSDLLYRATVVNESNVGLLKIPVGSSTAASWHQENGAGNEAAPTLSSIDLGGYELMRLMQVSAATMSRSTGEFEGMMLDLLSSENIETLEKSFITGVGNTMPLGLDAGTWNAGNQILTANAATPISPDNIAAAIGLLPQKYARNAILLMNAKSLYNIAAYSDANGDYIFAATEATSKFMGKEICVNEHILDDVIYIVDPKQLYVRFSMPLTVQADQSAGFTTASIYLRALCVVDAKWNPAACVRIGLGA